MKNMFAATLVCMAFTAAAFADQSIADVQRALKDQGYYYGEINGQKDADTTAAIRRYQIRNGLQISGDLNDETLKAIKSASANTALQSPAAPASNKTPPALAGDDDASDLRGDSAPQTRPLNPPSIQPGRQSDGDQFPERPNSGRPVPSGNGLFSGTPYETAPIEVQRKVITDAQRILAGRGLFRDEVNGAYGPSLEFSLRAYQSRVGLPASGRLDLETLAALQLLPGAHTPIFTPRRRIPSPETPVRGEWVRP
jgi:peptidoglycan hydrolase-like protein with peptidoglycan-binding domain